MINKMLYNYY